MLGKAAPMVMKGRSEEFALTVFYWSDNCSSRAGWLDFEPGGDGRPVQATLESGFVDGKKNLAKK